MNYILQTNSLTKKYKNFQALNGLTMNVPKGSIYGFVGKNGAGKTVQSLKVFILFGQAVCLQNIIHSVYLLC